MVNLYLVMIVGMVFMVVIVPVMALAGGLGASLAILSLPLLGMLLFKLFWKAEVGC